MDLLSTVAEENNNDRDPGSVAIKSGEATMMTATNSQQFGVSRRNNRG